MSLNGLDEAKVAEAYHAALSEAGGWFLLKYATRDTVELLARGVGGVTEVRSTVAQYGEKSPLYGLVQFRRKRIILKFVPDGTSRLLQVRLTVQFQSVLETFSPHDTVLSFATAPELTESALTAACMLHPSAMSLTSSASSVRKQKLGEIIEDTEEKPHVRGESKTKVRTSFLPSPPVAQEEAETHMPEFASIAAAVMNPPPFLMKERLPPAPTPLRAHPPLQKEKKEQSRISTATPTRIVPTPAPAYEVARSEKSLPATPEQTPPSTRHGPATKPSYENGLPTIQHLSNSFQIEEFEARQSINSDRPSVHNADETNPYSTYASYDPYKPKVKRGPRPHVELETRPKTAGDQKKERLVAGLPSSIRTANRTLQPSGRSDSRSGRPESRQSTRSVPSKLVQYSEPLDLPPIPSGHISSLFLPKEERQFPRAESITSTATARATPENLRLMKALQMRKKGVQSPSRTVGSLRIASSYTTSVKSQESPNLNEFQQPKLNGDNIQAEAKSGRNSREDEKVTETTRMTSPISMTEVSEVPSTQTSSEFVDDKDETMSTGSISSDTDSSITPTAETKGTRRENPPSMPTMNLEPELKPDPVETVVEPPKEPPMPVVTEGKPEELPLPVIAEEVPEKVPEENLLPVIVEDVPEEKPSPTVEEDIPEEKPSSTIVEDVAEEKPSSTIVEDVPEEKPVPVAVEDSQTKALKADPRPAAEESLKNSVPDFGSSENDLSGILTLYQPRETENPKDDKSFENTRASTSDFLGERRTPKKALEPIKLFSPALSDDSYEDDSFMDELQHATVEQAKPIAVGRSPITPVYRNLSKDFTQSASPLNSETRNPSSPEQVRTKSLRSTSTALPSWPPVIEPPAPLAKKGPLSHGISRRIKALEVFTSRDHNRDREPSPGASPPQPAPKTTLARKSKAALVSSKRRLSLISNSSAPNTSTSTPPPAPLLTADTRSQVQPSDFQQSNPQMQRKNSVQGLNASKSKGETISVTARIIRNPNMTNVTQAHDSINNPTLQLQRSALIIEHERSAEKTSRPATSREVSGFSVDDTPKSPRSDSRRPSISSYRSNSHGQFPQSDSRGSRLSTLSTSTIGRKKSVGIFARSISDKSSLNEEKPKSSRASRLMKRVSNLSRRNLAGSMTSKDEPAPDTIAERDESDIDQASAAESVSHVVDIGDLNVQFPDTLLWKRRFLRIDDQGNLIFTPPTMERNTRGISRRFHLSEFKRPTVPDVEREEMAWSILLDMEDGSSIQCACESKYSQGQVLRMIGDAHSAYHQLYSA